MFAGVEHAVGQIELDPSVYGEVDLGDLALPPGVAICGRAVDGLEALAEGSTVQARVREEPTPWFLSQRDLVVASARVVHRDHATVVGTDGSFALAGLEAGVEYALVAIPHHPEERTVSYLGACTDGRRVLAPDDPLAARSTWGSPMEFPLVGDRQGRLDLYVAIACATWVGLSAPGFESRTVRIDPQSPAFHGAGLAEIGVELDPDPNSAAIELRFAQASASFEGAPAFLILVDENGEYDYRGPQWLRDA